jgi:cell division protease FtsH
LLALMLGVTLAFSLNRTPAPTRNYTEIVGYFQDGRVREYSIDLGSGELVITKMDGATTPIIYRVPNVNLFIQDVHNEVIAYNKANPDNWILAEVKPA